MGLSVCGYVTPLLLHVQKDRFKGSKKGTGKNAVWQVKGSKLL
jgi:hypothetical protein